MRKMKKLTALLLAICLLCGLCLTACNGTGSSSEQSDEKTEEKVSKAEKALNKWEKAFKAADSTALLDLMTDREAASAGKQTGNTVTMDDLYEEFGEAFVNEALYGEQKAEETEETDAFLQSGELLSAVLEHSKITVEADKKGEEVTLTLTVPDLRTYLEKKGGLENCESPEEVYKALLDILEDEDWDTEEYEFETVMTQTTAGWRLVCTTEMLDALYGGLLGYYSEQYIASYLAVFEYIAQGGLSE